MDGSRTWITVYAAVKWENTGSGDVSAASATVSNSILDCTHNLCAFERKGLAATYVVEVVNRPFCGVGALPLAL